MHLMLTITSTLHRPVGVMLAVVLGLIALLHVYWALGGGWGFAGAGGGPEKPVPPALLIWIVAALLATAAVVVLGRAGVWGGDMPEWLFALGSWGLALALVLAALVNLRAHTDWARLGFGPLCLLLAFAAAVVARGY